MNQLTVEVTDISETLEGALRIDSQVRLGDPQIESRVNALLDRIKGNAKHAYLLVWEGNKVPHGAVVGNEVLGWTQHGSARNQSGQIVGTYDRVVEFGGDSGNKQVMIVYTS